MSQNRKELSDLLSRLKSDAESRAASRSAVQSQKAPGVILDMGDNNNVKIGNIIVGAPVNTNSKAGFCPLCFETISKKEKSCSNCGHKLRSTGLKGLLLLVAACTIALVAGPPPLFGAVN